MVGQQVSKGDQAMLTLHLSMAEQLTLLVALESEIRQLNRWSLDKCFPYWDRRRDQLFSIYRKAGGDMSLADIVEVQQQTEPAHHD
jgi:hypothetical protein